MLDMIVMCTPERHVRSAGSVGVPAVPTWTVDSNDVQVPLAIEVITNGRVAPYFTRIVEQRYDFYNFYSNMRPDVDLLEVSSPLEDDKEEKAINSNRTILR